MLKAEHISSIFIISGESLSITLYASFPDIFIYMPPIYFIYPLVKPAASLCGYIYPLRWTLSSKPRLISASQGYGRVSFSAVWLLMPVRHKPLSRLTGCGRLIRIIHPRKTPLARQRLKQRASHHRGERFFPADGHSGGSARLSLVRHARRRCHPAGLSFSHRGQTAGRSKGVRGGLSPSRARALCSVCLWLMD